MVEVVKGQRYRNTQTGLWGNLAPVWIVEDVAPGPGGTEHAHLICADEKSLRKTLATAVLKDKQRFEQLPDSP